MKKDIKQKLYSLCLNLIEQRIANAQLAINNAKESANDDTKSSAGDKHETGRAMAQLEQEKSAHQLTEALDLKKLIEKINPETKTDSIQVGSVVKTNRGNFFISVAVGRLELETEQYYAISIASPIGAKFKNLTKNDSFEINGIVYKILAVF